MCKLRRTMMLLLVALLLTATACARKSEQPAPTKVSIDDVRKQAAMAFDGTISSGQRRSAADEAMRRLLALLGQEDSTAISDEDWSKPPRPGVAFMVRHLDLGGGIHLYALALPGETLVEIRERVVVQVRKTGSSPQATELATLPNSRLRAARAWKEGSRQLVTLAFSQHGRGGYVAHFQAGGDGRFQPVSSAFGGLAGTYGKTTLAVKDGFLLVSTEGTEEWRPAFDEKEPTRLLLGPDLTLDWKGRFVLVDDSKFDGFALFRIAFDPARCKGPENCPQSLLELAKRSPKDVAAAAWEQATAKLTALLQNEKSWPDDFAGKLPVGARSLRQQGRDLSVRLITVPAPEGVTARAYTAVQFRTGGGIPMARTVNLPGVVEDYRLMNHEGLPALFLLVDQTKDRKSSIRTKGLHLLRLNAGNDWVPAEGWVGSIPNAPHWNLTGATPHGVAIEWQTTRFPNMTVSLGSGAAPAVSICKLAPDCHQLTWVGGKLHSLAILFAQLTEATQALPEEQLLWRAGQLAQFLAGIDPVEVTGSELLSLIDPNRALQMQVFEAGHATRLVTMPANPTGLRTAVIHAKDQGLVVKAYDGVVTRWEGARVVSGGDEQRLLILGRSDKGAVLLVYRWDGTQWIAIDALPERVDRLLMLSSRVVNVPGQVRPVRGLMVFDPEGRLTATLKADGARFCENEIACVEYGYHNGWQLQTK